MGLVGRKLLGFQPARANIALHGSFAATGAGHGTDKAIVAASSWPGNPGWRYISRPWICGTPTPTPPS